MNKELDKFTKGLKENKATIKWVWEGNYVSGAQYAALVEAERKKNPNSPKARI